ncbi:MAG: roadblock/LC7 domain-containing protein [Candidatus Firestonebacteria bacterium]|nr:roadblock/LC7 domain-containing protein [Candidatus Firestonebacteria bacterium]
MAGDKIEKLMDVLRSLKENTAFLESAAIVNKEEGLIIASTCKSEIEEQNIAAITATICSNSQEMISHLKKGNLKQLLLDTEEGYVLLCVINEATLLTIFTEKESSLGLIFLNSKKSLKKIAEILQNY